MKKWVHDGASLLWGEFNGQHLLSISLENIFPKGLGAQDSWTPARERNGILRQPVLVVYDQANIALFKYNKYKYKYKSYLGLMKVSCIYKKIALWFGDFEF